MASRRRLPVLLRAGVLALLSLLLPSAASASDTAPGALQDAIRLTWERDTRDEGISALRRLARADPEGVAPRLELARVLSWDRDTRDEAVTILRDLERETAGRPGHSDVVESLAEILSWDTATRDEAVEKLRALVARRPGRTSARLLLAEILSWRRETRDEAVSLYEDVLAGDPDSVEARSGLAEVLSWSGDKTRARRLYREVLEQDPGNGSARLGLAEVEQWTGQSRRSLKTLRELPEGEASTPEAHRRRAEAFADLDRPARAASEYRALLDLEPSDRDARQGLRDARRLLRPTLELGVAGSTESGQARTSRLESISVPLIFSFTPAGDARVRLLATASSFENQNGATESLALGAGVEVPLGEHVRFSAEATVHDYEDANGEVLGEVKWDIAPSDHFSFSVGGRRESLFSSRLSAAGEPIGGLVYGPVVADEVFAGVTLRPGRKWDVLVRGARADLGGDNVPDNNREQAYLGFGRTFGVGRGRLRPGYSLFWMDHDRDLGGFPPADLGGDGLTSIGPGGYFSPFRFLNQMIRLDAGWPAGENTTFWAGGGVGRQQVEDVGNRDFGKRTTSADLYAGVRHRITDFVAVRFHISYQDVAAAFDRTRARLSVIWSF